MAERKESKHFRNVVGVFEGGGVRGIALAGAYQAAADARVEFRGVVGTSAGSIIAALIAARVPPQEVIREISDLSLDVLLKPPVSLGLTGERRLRLLSPLLPKSVRALAQWISMLGMYSSVGIEEWLDPILRRHVYTDAAKVRMRDLKMPVAIVASNLGDASRYVWTREHEGDDAVSYAVRCSCSIPLFYQPVRHQSGYIVDGGILANLAVDMATELKDRDHLPVLAFRMKKSAAPTPLPEPLPLPAYIRRLVETVIAGNTSLELVRSSPTAVIEIDTAEFSTTDFTIDKNARSKLVSSGRSAVEAFVANEERYIQHSGFTAVRLKKRVAGAILTQSLIELARASESIAIFAGDLSWVPVLGPGLLHAAVRGVTIRLLFDKAPQQEERTLEQLGRLGVHAQRAAEPLHIRGLLIDSALPTARVLVVGQLGARGEDRSRGGRLLRRQDNPDLTRVIGAHFESHWNAKAAPMGGPVANPVPIADERVCEALRSGVTQYSDATVTVEDVDLSRTIPLTRFLEEFKIQRIKAVIKLLDHWKHPLFTALRFQGTELIVAPPVMERNEKGDHLVIDGTHRVFEAREQRRGRIRCVVVSGVAAELPAKQMAWDDIVVLPNHKNRQERYETYAEEEWRHVGDAHAFLGKRLSEEEYSW